MATTSLEKFFQKLLPKSKQNLKYGMVDDRVFVQKEHKCPACSAHLENDKLKENAYVCYNCNHHFRISAPERLRLLADNGEYQEFSAGLSSLNPLDFPEYEERVTSAKEKSGLDEAVKTVVCKILGREAVVMVMSFQFMGGSMGSVVGEKITRGILLAAQRGLPCILFTASGGARMQEGILSLMQMSKTSHAIALLEQTRMPFIVVLTDPTTGGVTASFAMLGDVTLAEPNALIGFAGPRVIEGTIKQKLPPGFQRAEFLQEKGFVDRVVPRKDLKSTLAFLMDAHLEIQGVSK
nr:acetyl-CoA carboxylase, carboxyltransferase subunit beta [Spirochaeta lutea]